MAKKLYAQDSFHMSGIGMFHAGVEINEDKLSAGDLKTLQEKGLIGETDVAAEKRAKQKENHENKMREVKEKK